MTIHRRLDTPESRAFWREPEPPPPKSKAARVAVAAEKRKVARRLEALMGDGHGGPNVRGLNELIAKLGAEATKLEETET